MGIVNFECRSHGYIIPPQNLPTGDSWPVSAMAADGFHVQVERGMEVSLSCRSGPRPSARRRGLACPYLSGFPGGTGSGRVMSTSQVQLSCSRCLAP